MVELHDRARLRRRTVLAAMAAFPTLPRPAGAAIMSDPAPQAPAALAASTIVFDVNETLLDFGVLGPVFSRVFDDGAMLRTWFDQVVIYSEALTLAGDYAESGAVGVAVLRMLADDRGRSVSPADLEELKRLSGTMPTYTDVPASLAALRAAGFRLVTLSNNPSAGVDAQLRSAGIRAFFDEIHSIDDRSKRYKPARESYEALASGLGIAPADLWLVSCHAFDTLGAAAVGYRTALVLRPGNAPIALGRAPDIVAGNLGAVADRIIAATGRARHG